MAELFTENEIEELLSQKAAVSKSIARNVSKLLEDGSSVPFICRYRKEKTGNLPPQKIHEIKEHFDEIKKIKENVHRLAEKLEKTGQLTQPIRTSLANCKTIEDVELIEEPFKQASKGTLAARARELNLEPIAMNILLHPDTVPNLMSILPSKAREVLQNKEQTLKTIGHIVADVIAKEPEHLKEMDSLCQRHPFTLDCHQTSTSKSFTEEKLTRDVEKFTIYFNFHYPVDRIQPHQILAINRAEKKKYLTVKMLPHAIVQNAFVNIVQCKYRLCYQSQYSAFLLDAINDSWARLVAPGLARKCRARLTSTAHRTALVTFETNLRNILMVAPTRNKTVLGIDPGFTHGCKLAVVDTLGNVVFTEVVYFKSSEDRARKAICQLLITFNVDLIALGNGQGCREVEKLLSTIILQRLAQPLSPRYAIVSECGASVYSASPLADKELPTLDVSLRGAVSIARRLQDPLAEMCKVDPKHLGVGMYQHDLPSRILSTSATSIVEECISFVGVDLNYAPTHLLQHVAGLSEKRAALIIEHRNQLPEGRFVNREQLMDVKGIGPRVFEQCAGFVKIFPPLSWTGRDDDSASTSSYMSVVSAVSSVCSEHGRKRKRPMAEPGNASSSAASVVRKKRRKKQDWIYNPLDQTIVHPESYKLVSQIVEYLGFTLKDINTLPLMKKCKEILTFPNKDEILDRFTMNDFGLETVTDIVTALSQPADFDIRQNELHTVFREGVTSLSKMSVGMTVQGQVVNVVSFGAFCDMGVDVDAFVHKSDFPRPHDVTSLKLGDRISAVVKFVSRSSKKFAIHHLQIC